MLRYFLTLAGKNLWRHKRRTILTFLAVAVGLYFFIILDSLLQGLDRQSIENLINLETSHLRVHAPGYWEEREELPLNRLLPDAEETLARIQEVPGVQAAAPRLFFMAQINNGVDELPV
ncbi:MAG: ABC transporter permease, partial [Bacillota bacterium]|nr:ABC transporter permease [Bacillota bacterium]